MSPLKQSHSVPSFTCSIFILEAHSIFALLLFVVIREIFECTLGQLLL